MKKRIIFAALLFGFSMQVYAELNLQLYRGKGITQNHNASVNLPDADLSGTHKNLSFDTAAINGARAIYWFDGFRFVGVGIDASHFNGPDQKTQVAQTDLCLVGVQCFDSSEQIQKFNNTINAFSALLMLRYPMLATSWVANGQVQPYLAVGPSVFRFTMKDTGNFLPAGQTSKNTSLGIMAGAGMMVYLTELFGVFLEYQDVNFQVKNKFYNERVVNDVTLGTTIGKATYNIQSVLAGIVIKMY